MGKSRKLTARRTTKTTPRTQGRKTKGGEEEEEVNGEEQESTRKTTNAAGARTNRNVCQEFISLSFLAFRYLHSLARLRLCCWHPSFIDLNVFSLGTLSLLGHYSPYSSEAVRAAIHADTSIGSQKTEDGFWLLWQHHIRGIVVLQQGQDMLVSLHLLCYPRCQEVSKAFRD